MDMILGYKNITLNFISWKGLKWIVSVRDREMETHGELLYWPLTYQPRCAFLLRALDFFWWEILNWRPFVGCCPPLSTHRPLCFPNFLTAPPLSEIETTRLTVTVVGVCIYHFKMPMCFWLSTHVTCFWLSTRMICLHPHMAVFLFTQLKHDGSIKSQYVTESQCASNPWIVFSTLAHSSKPIFSSFIKIFWLKSSSPYTLYTLCKFHMVCTSQPHKIWWQTFV